VLILFGDHWIVVLVFDLVVEGISLTRRDVGLEEANANAEGDETDDLLSNVNDELIAVLKRSCLTYGARAVLPFSITGGSAATMMRTWPTSAKTTATWIVLNFPRY
jgi:hypothetical protein